MQRAAAGALRTLAFKNEENKNLIVECSALPTLIQMLRSDDVGIHYEAVGVIGNLVHSSQGIKKTVLSVSRRPANHAVSSDTVVAWLGPGNLLNPSSTACASHLAGMCVHRHSPTTSNRQSLGCRNLTNRI